MNAPHARRAMTLVEILAVVVILGLVAGILAVSFGGGVSKAKFEAAKTAISIIESRLETYHLEHGTYPGSDVGLKALSDGHATPTSAYYLKPDQLIDPWENPYQYMAPGRNGHPFEVVSFGEDGQRGGTDNAADLSSADLGRATKAAGA